MSKRIFIDSSVFIEALKGNPKAIELLKHAAQANMICVSSTVVSEVVYIYVREKTDSSTEELRRSPDLVKKVHLDNLEGLLLSCKVLEEDGRVVELALDYIKRYGLLPNDALILAVAKLNNCSLLTLDEVLKDVAAKEGLEVL